MDGISYETKVVPVASSNNDPSDPSSPSPSPSSIKTKTVRVLREPSTQDAGLSLRCINELFAMIQAQQQQSQAASASSSKHPQYTYTISCNFLQIYQENVYDLLADNIPSYIHPGQTQNLSSGMKPSSSNSNSNTTGSGLKIRWSPQSEFYVENLYTFPCHSARETRSYFMQGMRRRMIASHKMNAVSSRSHCIFTVVVKRKLVGGGGGGVGTSTEEQVSKLTLVDLAGSERQALTGAQGEVLQQSIGINKSLFVLRKVIKALAGVGGGSEKTTTSSTSAASSRSHIPYRDSTLTRLLKHSLGGNCYTLMLACLNPSDAYSEENISTLKYASMTKRIENRQVRNEDPKTVLIRKLKKEVKMLRQMLAAVKERIVIGGSGGGGGENSSIINGSSTALTPHHQQLTYTDSTLAEKFIDTVSHLKQLLSSNTELRSAYDQHAQQLDDVTYQNSVLENENNELRERVRWLENMIVDAEEGEDGGGLLKSPDAATRSEIIIDDEDEGEETNGRIDPDLLTQQLEELRLENERLKAMMIETEYHHHPQHHQRHHQQSSRRSAPASAASSSVFTPATSQFISPSNHIAYNGGSGGGGSSFSPATTSTLPPRSSSSSSSTSSSSRLTTSSNSSTTIVPPPVVIANPHVNSIYKTNHSTLATLSALQGRSGRISMTGHKKKSSSSTSSASMSHKVSEWARQKEMEIIRDRDDHPPPSTVRSAWNDTSSSRSSSMTTTSYPITTGRATSRNGSSGVGAATSNLNHAVQSNSTIAMYMKQQQQQQQQQQLNSMNSRSNTSNLNATPMMQHAQQNPHLYQQYQHPPSATSMQHQQRRH